MASPGSSKHDALQVTRLLDQREVQGRVSTIISTNLDYPAWYGLFDNKPLVDALLDRLQHHCIAIRIDGPSLRAPETTQAPASPPALPAIKRTAKTPTSAA